MILLDTSILIAPPDSWPEDSFGASVLALAELSFGIQSARTTAVRNERTQRLAAVRTLFAWLPFDEHAAESYGLLAANVSRTRPADARSKDILMAAHAHSLGVPLMTRNARDFQLISDLVEIIDVG